MAPNVANTKVGTIDIFSHAPEQTILGSIGDVCGVEFGMTQYAQFPKSMPEELKQCFRGKEEVYEETMTLANTKLTTDRNTSYLVFLVVVILLGPVTCCAAPLLWMLWSCVNPAHQGRKHHMESVVFAPWAELGMKVEYIDTDARQQSGTGESLPSIIRVSLPSDAMQPVPAQDNSINDQDALPKILGSKTEAKKSIGS